MRVSWESRAWEDYLYWQNQDKKTLSKINILIKEMQRSPFDGQGKPEPLRGNLTDYWSRRIDYKNSLQLNDWEAIFLFQEIFKLTNTQVEPFLL